MNDKCTKVSKRGWLSYPSEGKPDADFLTQWSEIIEGEKDGEEHST